MRGEDIIGNVSKFYINNNKVIDHPAEISKKQDLNNFAMQLAKGQNSK